MLLYDERLCKDCKNFKETDGIYGTCKLVEGCIGATCHKYQWCVSFEKNDK